MTQSGINAVTVVLDNVSRVVEGIQLLASTRVMVGVPEGETEREGGGITNAALAYIHNNGAPEVGIPQRQFMEPGIQSVQDKIEDRLYQTAVAASEGKVEAAGRGFHQAGLIAQGGIRRKITDGPFVPLKPATIAARRRRSKGSSYRRKAATAKDVKPLIDTAQMRNSITYAVRSGREP